MSRATSSSCCWAIAQTLSDACTEERSRAMTCSSHEARCALVVGMRFAVDALMQGGQMRILPLGSVDERDLQRNAFRHRRAQRKDVVAQAELVLDLGTGRE